LRHRVYTVHFVRIQNNSHNVRMSTVTFENCDDEQYKRRSTSKIELHPCQFKDGPSTSLLRLDDVDLLTVCTNADAVHATAQPVVVTTTWPVPAVRMDLEAEFGPWAYSQCVFVPVLGGAEVVQVPASRTTRLRTAKAGHLARNGPRTPQVSFQNSIITVRTPVHRRTSSVGNQSLASRSFDDTAFRQCQDHEDGWSTSIYIEHYRRHCTAENVGSVAVGEKTSLADLNSADDPYLRKRRSAR